MKFKIFSFLSVLSALVAVCVAISIFCSACILTEASPGKITMVGIEVISLKVKYEKAVYLLNINRNKFTQDEWDTLAESNKTIEEAISSIETVKDLETVIFLWEGVSTAYKNSRPIIKNKLSSMDNLSISWLNMLDAQAVKLNTEIEQLVNSSDAIKIRSITMLLSELLNITVKSLALAAI